VFDFSCVRDISASVADTKCEIPALDYVLETSVGWIDL
jgi:hypothetical protein